MTVEIVDTPLFSHLKSKPDIRTQIGNTSVLPTQNDTEEQENDNYTLLSEDTQTEETMKDYTQWELSKETKARLGKGRVPDIQFSPDGTQFVVGTSIGVWLYDANSGEEIALFTDDDGDNHGLDRSYINMLISISDDKIIACQGLDRDKDLWDLEEDSLKSILPDLRSRDNVLQFRAENIELTYSDWKMHLPWHTRAGMWNLKDEANKSIEAGMMKTGVGMHIAISPDKRYLAAAHDSRYWGKEYNLPAIQVWDRTTGQRVFTVEEKKDDIRTLTFSPDNKTLAYTASSNIVKIWDVKSNSLMYMFKTKVPLQIITFSPDGNFLAGGSADDIVRFWKVKGRGNHSISDRVANIAGKFRPQKMLKGHANNSKFAAIAFASDGKKVATANSDGTICLWDTDSEEQQFTLTHHSESQTALAFNTFNQSRLRDGSNRTLTSIGLSNSHFFVSVWDIDTGNRLSIDRIENGIIYEVAISPDGSLFVTDDNAIRLWDTQLKSVLSTIGGHEYYGFQAKVVFSPDGDLLAASARKDNTIQIWDVPTRKTRCRLEGHTTYVYSLAFSPDNKTVLTSGWTYKDVTIRLWDTMTGAELASFLDQGAVAFAPDSKTFVGGTHIYRLNPETFDYECVARLEDVSKSNPPNAITFSLDGTILISGNRDGLI